MPVLFIMTASALVFMLVFMLFLIVRLAKVVHKLEKK